MGEIAEMMLDGTMCAGCGEFFHDGDDSSFPRYCAGCSPDYEDVPVPKNLKSASRSLQSVMQSTIDRAISGVEDCRNVRGLPFTKADRKKLASALSDVLSPYILKQEGV